MKANVGGFDQAARIMVGLVLIIMAIGGVVGGWGYLVGLIVAATGFVGFCGAYTLLGINTCAVHHD
jgi:hypothetical protein